MNKKLLVRARKLKSKKKNKSLQTRKANFTLCYVFARMWIDDIKIDHKGPEQATKCSCGFDCGRKGFLKMPLSSFNDIGSYLLPAT